jgi:hypothetical protein
LKKTLKDPAYANWEREVSHNGYEVLSRLGGPKMIHKRGQPYTIENCVIVYHSRKLKRKPRDEDHGYSKNQLKGIKIFTEMGFRVSRHRYLAPFA